MRPVKALFHQIFRVRSVISLALMLWTAGAGCMMVSYAQSMRTEAASTDGSSSMDAHACCKARKQSKGHAVSTEVTAHLHQFEEPSSVPSSAMNCCPLTNGLIVTQSRSQSKSDEAATTEAAQPQPLAVNESRQVSYAGPLRLHNQERTYLIGCAFLI